MRFFSCQIQLNNAIYDKSNNYFVHTCFWNLNFYGEALKFYATTVKKMKRKLYSLGCVLFILMLSGLKSPAQELPEKGDVIIAVDDQKVTKTAELQEKVALKYWNTKP